MSWKAVVIDFVYFLILMVCLGLSGYVMDWASIAFWLSSGMIAFYPDFTMWIERRF